MIIKETNCKDWQDLMTNLVSFDDSEDRYIWRGQKYSSWKLESNLHRFIRNNPNMKLQESNEFIIKKFNEAILGRRGSNPVKLKIEETWALGQHYGLYTPLLDWTMLPFVAVFFAFIEPILENEKQKTIDDPYRIIYALDTKILNEVNKKHKKDEKFTECLEIIRPKYHENNRLLNQRGLFTQNTFSCDITEWARNQKTENKTLLHCYKLSHNYRDEVLKYLNKMNISHLTLFPDLSGSSQYVNNLLSIKMNGG